MATIRDIAVRMKELNDQLTGLTLEYNQKAQVLKDSIETLEQFVAIEMQEQGLQNLKVDGVYKFFFKTKRVTKVVSWDEFIEWVKATGNYDYLTHNCRKEAVLDHYDTKNELPPGVGVETIRDLHVNKD